MKEKSRVSPPDVTFVCWKNINIFRNCLAILFNISYFTDWYIVIFHKMGIFLVCFFLSHFLKITKDKTQFKSLLLKYRYNDYLCWDLSWHLYTSNTSCVTTNFGYQRCFFFCLINIDARNDNACLINIDARNDHVCLNRMSC